MTLRLLLGLTLLSSCDGFAQKPFPDIFSRLNFPASPGRRSSTVKKPDPEQVLRDLDLSASTKPVLAGARPQQIPNLLSASLPAVLRLCSGIFAEDYRISIVPRDDSRYTYLQLGNFQLEERGVYRPPQEPLVMYDTESNPSCRLVREACSMLSLTVTFRPVPVKGTRFRPEIEAEYGKLTDVPIMIDPNTKSRLVGSEYIIEYLFQNYGNRRVPWTVREDSAWVGITAALSVGLARLWAGRTAKASVSVTTPLVLWAYEGSPFCKVVRETLSSLELPHTVKFTPRGSVNRQRLWEKTGRFQVPYLEDPNTGVALFESEAIVEYLGKRYGLKTPVKYL
jgi:glutathione S-transferase